MIATDKWHEVQELVERAFMRIASTDTDEQFESVLQKFLTPILLKLSSQDEEVRKNVMELLVHLNKRLKSRSAVKLPVSALLDQFNDASNASMVTNFSMIYLKMGFSRLDHKEQVEMIPKIQSTMVNKPMTQIEQLLVLLLPAYSHVKFGEIATEKHREMYGLPEETSLKTHLLDLMLDIIMMPYTAHFPDPAKPELPAAPALFNEVRYQRLVRLGSANTYPDATQIGEMKAGLVNLLTSEAIQVMDKVIHLIIASSDSRPNVATPAELSLQRLMVEVNWEDTSFIKKLMMTWIGTPTLRRDQVIQKSVKVLGAPSRVKLKLLPLILKSKIAAQTFPFNIQIACDGLAGPDTNVKLKKLAVSFINNIAQYMKESSLKPIASTLLSYLYKLVQTAEIPRDIKMSSYITIGNLVRAVPSIVHDNINVVNMLISNLKSETFGDIKASIYDALKSIETSLAKSSKDNKMLLEILMFQEFKSEEKLLRKICISYSSNVFDMTSIPSRYLLLIAASDSAHDIASEAVKLLHTKPIHTEQSTVELYPDFDDMCRYVSNKQNEIISTGQTFTRGRNVIAYKLETLNEIVLYLRSCLAWSCGIKQVHCTNPEDWLDQAPSIYKHYNKGQRPDAQPAKLQKLNNEGSEFNPFLFYSQLIISSIDLQANVSNSYLLLEILSAQSDLSSKVYDRKSWFMSQLNHHDSIVQHNMSQCLVKILLHELQSSQSNTGLQDVISEYRPSIGKSELRLEHQLAACFLISDIISLSRQNSCDQLIENINQLTLDVVTQLVKMLDEPSKSASALQLLSQISISGSLCLPQGEPGSDALSSYKLVKKLSDLVKSAHTEPKDRERIADCLGSMGIGDREFKWRKMAIDGLFECSSTKELELHFTVGQALVLCAQALDSASRRDIFKISQSDYSEVQTISGDNEMEYLVTSILEKYINHTNPHIKQAACVWLLTTVKSGSHFTEVKSRSKLIQQAFLSMLSAPDDMTQDVAAKGLGLMYDSCSEDEKKELVNGLVDTLLTGKSTQKKTGEIGSDTKLFTESSLGKTPEGQGMSTYKELCSIATDLNQPDLIYKFLHLANHQNMWNSRKGAAFGFSTIAAQAGSQLAPHMSRIVPRLYRYMFDPNPKIQLAMRSIWNSCVQETKSTVDKYLAEILDDLLTNLENNQWRVRESCCLAVNDLIRGRQLDEVLDRIPGLWHSLFRILDDIKESTRVAAQSASKTLSRVCIKISDSDYGKKSEESIKVILPVLLNEGLLSTVQEVRSLSLNTIVSMTKNAGSFLKPHISTLVPVMLESLTELEPQYLNYVALRVGSEEAQQSLDKARIAASKSSPMMDSINLCIRQVDGEVLSSLVPRLVDLIKSSIGLGTKAGVSNVITSICLQCTKDELQPHAGKFMAALLNHMTDKNSTVRKSYSASLAHICKIAKSTSVEKLTDKLHTWYIEKQDEVLHEACCLILKSMSHTCPDTLNEHKSKILPIVFLAMHKQLPKDATPSEKTLTEQWKEIWTEVTIGTESTVRLYTEELISISSTALQSNSWLIKAQGASAMKAIAASSSASNLEGKHLTQILTALLDGLTGRTWNGKESLLEALAQVVSTCKTSIKSESSSVSSDQIVTTILKEANKQSLNYKIPAVRCLGEVLEQLQVDKYDEVWDIIMPLLNPEADHSDNGDVNDKMISEFRETAFTVIGQIWTEGQAGEKADERLVQVLTFITTEFNKLTWKEQLQTIKSTNKIISRTTVNKSNVKSVELLSVLLNLTREITDVSKYSALRESAAQLILDIITSLKDSDIWTDLDSELKVNLSSSAEKMKSDQHLPIQKLSASIIEHMN